MKWIDSTDIKQWADKKDCQLNLGYLLYQLINESVSEICQIRFTYGDATQYSGWDGTLNSAEETEKIPLGTSVWEWGCDENFKSKASKDYEKRTKNPMGYKLEDTTFFFVTPREWEDNKGKNTKTKWIEQRKNDGWKDIKIYDAIDLENWVERNPVSGLWLAQNIRKYPDNSLQSAQQFWDDWTMVSENFKIPASLVLAGRAEQATKLRKWLTDKDNSAFVLRAFTREESLAFLCAVIETLDEEERKFYFSKTIIVTDVEVFAGIYRIHKNHILVNYFDETDTIPNAVTKGNKVFIPIGPDSTNINENAELEVLGKNDFETALKESGMPDEEVSNLSKESGRSLSVLRRLLQDVKNQPSWAKGEKASKLVPALLLGRWDDTQIWDKQKKKKSKYEDKKIVEAFSRKPYNEYLSELTIIKNEQDPPLFQFSEKWRLVSPIDAWFALTPFITSKQLEDFGKIVIQVIGAYDPEFELDEDERYKAETLGVKQQYSDWLTDGILQTLILIALYGKKITVLGNEKNAQEWIDNIVSELLRNADEKRWFSLANSLPQLAEASPEAFLTCVEEAFNSDDPKIMILFREGSDTLFSRCNHSGLLWALEALAWSPQYLTRVILILGKLVTLDKGGRWANRPNGSLRGILLAWLPYTLANLEQRLEAIDELCEADKVTGFNLLLELMPKPHDIGHPTYKPRWRWFSELKTGGVTYAEIYKTYSAILDRLLTLAGNDGMMLAKVLPSYDDYKFSLEGMDKIYNCIETHLDTITIGKEEIRNTLRTLISRHRTYQDTDWALPEAEVKKLEKLYTQIEPEDKTSDYKLLFDDHYPELLNVSRKNHEELENAIEEERLMAVNSILDSGGLKGVLDFSGQVKFPAFLGESFAKSEKAGKEDELKVIELFGENEQSVNFARGFVFRMEKTHGNNWIEKIVDYLKSKSFCVDLIVNFFISLRHSEFVWDLIEGFGEEVKRAYWSKCNGLYGNDYPAKMKNRYYHNMISVKRFLTALDTASMYPKDIDTEVIVQILEKAGTEKANEPYKSAIDPYNCIRLFKLIDKRTDFEDDKRIYQLEWLYLSVLSSGPKDRPPKIIHKDMAENASSFVQVLKFVYKPKGDDKMMEEEIKGLTEEQISNLAKKGFDLLYNFKTIPGRDENGVINYEKLSNWVYGVIDESKKVKRVHSGYYCMGELFAKGIKKDKIPPDEICRIIEEVNNKDLEQGFSIATYNRRGTISKSMWEGGIQERSLAENYFEISKELAKKKYRRTSLIYERIGKSYEHKAQNEDDRAKEMESEY